MEYIHLDPEDLNYDIDLNPDRNSHYGIVRDIDWKIQRDYFLGVSEYIKEQLGDNGIRTPSHVYEELGVYPESTLYVALEYSDIRNKYFPDIVSGSGYGCQIGYRYDIENGYLDLRPEFRALHAVLQNLLQDTDNELNPGLFDPSRTPQILETVCTKLETMCDNMTKAAKYGLICSLLHGCRFSSKSTNLYKIGAKYSQEGIRRSILEYAF